MSSAGVILYGDTTRHLYEAWHARLGGDTAVSDSSCHPLPSPLTVHHDTIQPLFNDIGLFPSKSQVFEMLHCARECGQRAQDNFITFGEFCVFATELQKYYTNHNRDPASVASHPVQVSKVPDRQLRHQRHHHHNAHNNHQHSSSSGKSELKTQRSTTSAYDVFLGGSCNPTTWRKDVAIPHLKAQGITFYNPQQANWKPEMVELEHQAKNSSQILFWVLDTEKTRNVASMVEVSQFSGSNRRLIVVVSPFPGPDHTIAGEPITKAEYEDLQNGVETVQDLIERQGTPVFASLEVALACTSKVLKENLAIEELGLADQAQPVRLAHVQIGDKLIRLREAFDTLDTGRTGQLSLAEIKMAFRIHVHRDLRPADLQAICSSHGVNAPLSDLPLDQIFVQFDEFCSLVSEYKGRLRGNGAASGNCSSSSGVGVSDIVGGGTASASACTAVIAAGGNRGDNILNKTVHFFATLVSPVSRAAAWLSSVSSLAASSSSVTSSAASRARSFSTSAMAGRRGSAVRDVYLGGAMASTWREQVAIPMLKKSGLTFYNPAVCSSRRLIPIEASAMDNSRVLLFALLGDARCLAAMCEAAYLIGLGCNVVLCVQYIQPGARINGEPVSKLAMKDYNRGRTYLSEYANREGIPIFEEVKEALECVIQKCKTNK